MTTISVTFAHSLKTTSINPQIMSFLLQTGHQSPHCLDPS